MRYGCCVNMISDRPQLGGADVVEKIKKAGFDYAELSLTHLNMLEPGKLKILRDLLHYYSLPAESSNNFFPPEISLTGNKVDYKIICRYIDKCFETALFFGFKTIVFGSGGARMVPKDFPPEKAWEQLVDLLNRIVPYARQCQIKIAIEPLRKQECNIINTYEEACSLAQMVNSPEIGCLADSFHLHEENEPTRNIVAGKKHLSHVHVSFPVGRIFPLATHRSEMERFIAALAESNYDQRVSIEAFTSDFEHDAPISLSLLKSLYN